MFSFFISLFCTIGSSPAPVLGPWFIKLSLRESPDDDDHWRREWKRHGGQLYYVCKPAFISPDATNPISTTIFTCIKLSFHDIKKIKSKMCGGAGWKPIFDQSYICLRENNWIHQCPELQNVSVYSNLNVASKCSGKIVLRPTKGSVPLYGEPWATLDTPKNHPDTSPGTPGHGYIRDIQRPWHFCNSVYASPGR